MRFDRAYEPVDGEPPGSPYCETFWLPILGPSSYVLSALVAARVPWESDPEDLAARMGMGEHRVIGACERLVGYRIWRKLDGSYLIPEKVRLLNAKDVRRLPDPLPALHLEWESRPEVLRGHR